MQKIDNHRNGYSKKMQSLENDQKYWTSLLYSIDLAHLKKESSHKSLIGTRFMTKNSTNTVDQPPYLPDLVPGAFLYSGIEKCLTSNQD